MSTADVIKCVILKFVQESIHMHIMNRHFQFVSGWQELFGRRLSSVKCIAIEIYNIKIDILAAKYQAISIIDLTHNDVI